MADDVTEPIEQSWPVEEKPLPGSQWAPMMMGLGNGILDQGGFPYRLVFGSDANATNQGTLRCPTIEGKKYGAASLEGFFHKYTADKVLDFPAVTKTTRYFVVLQFDPIAVTEGGLPISAQVVKSLDYTGGKNYLHLYNVDREPNQLLTDATVRMVRPRVAPVTVYASEADMPQASKTLWGTLAVVHNGRNTAAAKIFMAMNTNTSGEDAEDSWWWKPIYDQTEPTWQTVSDYENSVGAPGGGSGPKELLRDGSTRKLQGRIARRDGSAYSDSSSAGYLVATLGSQDTPRYSKSSIVRCGGGTNGSKARGFVEVSKANSEVRLYIQEGSCLQVDLCTVEWSV